MPRQIMFQVLALTAAAFLATSVRAQEGKAVSLLNGKDLTGWKVKGNNTAKSKWVVGKASLDPKNPGKIIVGPVGKTPDDQHLINSQGGGVDIFSTGKFGSGAYEVEVMVPKGSNSGIYVSGEYEIQVLDSFGKKRVGPGDLGGIYGASAPRINAAKKPGEWQKFVIEYQAPRFENGKKVANARFVKVVLNGKVIHENVEVKGSTGGALARKEAPEGPLMFQGDHGPVAYRNIKFTPKK